MENARNDKFTRTIMGVCYGILFFFMLTILLRLFTRIILVERLQIEDNAFINALFFDQPTLTNTKNGGIFLMNEDGENVAGVGDVNWAERYPFSAEDAARETSLSSVSKIDRLLNSYENAVASLTGKFTYYCTDLIFCHDFFVGGMNWVRRFVGWNISALKDYNSVVTLTDGRLTEYLPRLDVVENASSVIELKEYCGELGLDFLYVQSPYAICRTENADVSGVLDFSNENADNLLAQLAAGGVTCLDMRTLLHADGLSHAEAFYRTDHHWTANTGLWAAKMLAQNLNEAHGFSVDAAMLEPDRFSYEMYHSWWLGSRGRKLTSIAAEPEDFTIIYPDYETLLRYEIPEQSLDELGAFSITYDMTDAVRSDGYSPYNSYSVYNHGDKGVIILTNKLCTDGKKILIIKDSFVNVVSPFLACTNGISELDVLDVRHFTGSARTFICEKQPDIVILWYNPSTIGEIDWNTHKSPWDFR